MKQLMTEPTTTQVVDRILEIEAKATKAYNEWNRNRPATCDMNPEEDYLFWVVRQLMIEENQNLKNSDD